MADGSMRLDRFLWFARVAKTRDAAQALGTSGHLRIDGRAIDRAHAAVRIGNVLTFAQHDRIRVLRIEALPPRRGPAPEARTCYQELTAGESGFVLPGGEAALARLTPEKASGGHENVSQQAPND